MTDTPWTFAGALAALALATACSPASPAGGDAPGSGGATAALPVVFTDPTENAFTIAAPQGWNVTGGVQRTSASGVQTWTIARSPDGGSAIVIGDPSLPADFALPTQMNAPGSTAQGPDGSPIPVAPYESGAQFAATYAQQVFGPACQALQPAGAGGGEPGLAQAAQAKAADMAGQIGMQPSPISYDGGSAHFVCQANGVSYAVGVIAVTGIEQTQVGGFWLVPTLIGYRAPLASQAQVEAQARAMQQSYQVNAQWQAKMIGATRQVLTALQQQGAQAMADMQRMQLSQFATSDDLLQRGQAARNAEQGAFMTSFNAQGAAFQANQAQQQQNQATQAQGLTGMAGQ